MSRIFLFLFSAFCSFSASAENIYGTSGDDEIFLGDLWCKNIFYPFNEVNKGVYDMKNGVLTAHSISAGETILIDGGAGADYIEVINATDGNIPAIGYFGICAVTYSGTLKPITSASPGTISLRGSDGTDEIHGSDWGDVIWGGRGNDTLYGNNGADMVCGRTYSSSWCSDCIADDDSCFGGSGSDGVACNGISSGGASGGDVCRSEWADGTCESTCP